jgi:Flp pilus assembly protein TadG
MSRRTRRFAADQSGVTVVEFAFVSPVLLLLMIGLVDLGYRSYMSMMLQGALNEAARQVTVGGITSDAVQTFVRGRVSTISSAAAAGTIVTPSSFYDFTGIKTLEPITTDKNNNGQLDAGDCYTDYNGNKVRDTNGGASGLGTSDDIVYYNATMTYTSLVPIQSMIGWSSQETITVMSMMRNQPYGAQPTPATVCI